MNQKTNRTTRAFICAGILASALGAGFSTAGAQTLTGAGSTFVNPIMSQWIKEYQQETGVAVNYQPVGSGAGINNLINHTVDFAGSDAPMNPTETASAKGAVLHLPDVIGAVCVAYNIKGVGPGIRLTGPVIADIFLGNIEYWDDPKITTLNPGTPFPHDRIFTVHRSDASGTTNIFTDYLCKVSSAWKDSVGEGKAVKWPNGLGGKGTSGVAGILTNHDSSIGYIEIAYAVTNNIPYAAVRNAHGKPVYPSVATAALAAEGVHMPPDLKVFFTNTSNPDGYPITGFSWIIVYQNSPKSADLKKFLNWVVTTGQKDNEALYYAPLPEGVLAREKQMIESMR